MAGTTNGPRQIRDLSCGDFRIYLEVDVRRINCRKREKARRERQKVRPIAKAKGAKLLGDLT
jgi:hypothetical protein